MKSMRCGIMLLWMDWKMNRKVPLRGEIWFVDLNPTIGHEQAKTRPCLVISHDIFNRSDAYMNIILPITSKDKNNPLHIPLYELYEGVLEKKSFILCDQIRTVARQRFRGIKVGVIGPQELDSVDYIMTALLGIKLSIG